LYNSYGIFKLLAKEGIVGCVPFKTLRKVQMVCELDKLIPAQTDVILSRFLIDISGIKIRSAVQIVWIYKVFCFENILVSQMTSAIIHN
jgi:hypothetical protein